MLHHVKRLVFGFWNGHAVTHHFWLFLFRRFGFGGHSDLGFGWRGCGARRHSGLVRLCADRYRPWLGGGTGGTLSGWGALFCRNRSGWRGCRCGRFARWRFSSSGGSGRRSGGFSSCHGSLSCARSEINDTYRLYRLLLSCASPHRSMKSRGQGVFCQARASSRSKYADCGNS